MKRFLAIALLAVALACARGKDRTEWLAMPPAERVLYVKVLLGGENAKKAKGGNDRTYSKSPAEYAKEIDSAYAHGDQRSVADIFASLADRPSS